MCGGLRSGALVSLVGAATLQVQSDLQSLDLSSEWNFSGFEKEFVQVCALGVASIEYPEYEPHSAAAACTTMSSMPDVACGPSATVEGRRRSGAPFSHGSTGLSGSRVSVACAGIASIFLMPGAGVGGYSGTHEGHLRWPSAAASRSEGFSAGRRLSRGLPDTS